MAGFIQGVSRQQATLFPELLDDYIADETPVRVIDAFVEGINLSSNCKICQEKNGPEISPPYLIKTRLYRLSSYFKANLTLSPSRWRRPWFTLDRWRDVVFKNKQVKPSEECMSAFSRARRIEE